MELVVASLVGAVLMAGLWSLFRTYERLFTTGESKTEQAQLVRTLLDQLADDLRSAIADNAMSPAGGSSAVRRFGLFGSSQALQVDVLQVVPAQGIARLQGSKDETRGHGRSRQVPELHTVQWRFEAPESRPSRGGAAWSGLVRRELDWETPSGGGPGAYSSRASGASGFKGKFTRHASDPESFLRGRLEVDPDDDSILWVPEVVDIGFRYFDGTGWSDQWNSLSRKSLPLAVEVTLSMRTGKTGDEDLGSRTTTDREEGDGESVARPGSAALEAAETPSQTHRMIVHLPTTSLARRTEAEPPAGASAAPPPPTAVFRVPPRRAPPASPPPAGPPPAVNLVRPDQWMRTGP